MKRSDFAIVSERLDKIQLFIASVRNRVAADEAMRFFEDEEIDSNIYSNLINAIQDLSVEDKMRVYSIASKAATGEIREILEKKSLGCVLEMVKDGTTAYDTNVFNSTFKKETCDITMPLRVNWCGTWTDTPPYCLENGGAVVNAAVNINGISPVKVLFAKIDEPKIVLEYFDSGLRDEFVNSDRFSDLTDPLEPFQLLKAALVVCGVIPDAKSGRDNDIFEKLGGGLLLSTGVSGIPKGSGLGTSSILLAACIKALFNFTGRAIDNAEICRLVLLAEQLMGTGGGWQDQAGGLSGGIKLVTSAPGHRQDVKTEPLIVPARFSTELNERFCLVYSGKRRLGRTILREIMGGYMQSNPSFLKALDEFHLLAEEMSLSVTAGDMEGFIETFNRQTELTNSLGTGFMNKNLYQILDACAGMTAGKMMCGAGGGGFIQIILKKGFAKQDLSRLLKTAFPGQGIDVWRCDFV